MELAEEASFAEASTKAKRGPNIFVIGMAMFSMFFGSGNVTFPVVIGQVAQNQSIYALLGLMLTAVLVPFAGLVTMSLYDGNYFKFFERLGKMPAWAIIIAIMGLIGPLAIIPRCIVISHSSISTFFEVGDLFTFSLVSCVIIYLLTYRRSRILDILGYFLTPVLLLSLFSIIYMGLIDPQQLSVNEASGSSLFLYGLLEGYNTLDLFGSFMFSGVVMMGIRNALGESYYSDTKKLLSVNFKSSFVGIFLLAAIYAGMCFVAAFHGQEMGDVSADKLLSLLTLKLMGPSAGIVVSVAVSFACLTTALSLALIFAEFLSERVLRKKISYRAALMATLAISLPISTLQFTGIQSFLVPIMKVVLPALVVLTVLNFGHKVWGWTTVKAPVLIVFLGSLAYYLFV
ncbi:MAG: branched-chain amino acid transport system II carrier protein [Deltaproteobacteria bacterium]|nr:branched-chain amino acid transport system II carrier protein [Deltaproteobacteria bacterium]